MSNVTIELLPVAQGDALWVEWKEGQKQRRMLIDGGPARRYSALRDRVSRLPADDRRIDLFVITHIDTDHIDGAVTVLLDDLDVEFGDIWFNGKNHVDDPLSPVAGNHYLGGVQGEVLSAILSIPRLPWNQAFGGTAIVRKSGQKFPSVPLGEFTLTVLSPDVDRLEALAGDWDVDVASAMRTLELVPEGSSDEEIADAIAEGGFEVARALLDSRYRKRLEPPAEWDASPEDFVFLGDSSKPNGSSIAFLFEDANRETAVLFTGDAYDNVLFDSITDLLIDRGEDRLRLDALKLPHHGSKENISAELLSKLDCDAFLFSSDGSCGYDHPDDEAVELIIKDARARGKRPQLFFNYLSDRTKRWKNDSEGNGVDYDAHYPTEGAGEHGITITI